MQILLTWLLESSRCTKITSTVMWYNTFSALCIHKKGIMNTLLLCSTSKSLRNLYTYVQVLKNMWLYNTMVFFMGTEEKPTTIRRLLAGLPINAWRGSRCDWNLNLQLTSCWKWWRIICLCELGYKIQKIIHLSPKVLSENILNY